MIAKGELALGTGFNDFTTSATIDAVLVPDDSKGNDEEKVLVVEGMIEVTNEEQTLFPGVECGIIENNGVVACDSVRVDVVQLFEVDDVETVFSGNVVRPVISGGICELDGICC